MIRPILKNEHADKNLDPDGYWIEFGNQSSKMLHFLKKCKKNNGNESYHPWLDAICIATNVAIGWKGPQFGSRLEVMTTWSCARHSANLVTG